MHVARLVASDLPRYRALMLHAYAAVPDAFTSTAEERAVLFDFDGVLTTDKTGSLATTSYLGRRTSLELSKVQSAFRRVNDDLTLGRTTHAAIWSDLCADLGQAIGFELPEEAF